MSAKKVRLVLAHTMEDLSKEDFKKFCHQLLDRQEEPRVRRSRVEGKSRLDVIDVLVSTFTEDGAVKVMEEVLRDISCTQEAETLVKEIHGGR